MCGIAGYFGTQPISQEVLHHTLQQMRRRGPDHQQFIEFKFHHYYCYLLHSRLSIIDLDARAHQPFQYKNKSLIYNGEIYNYLEIRNRLIGLGHEFRTTSDTEVLIHALDEWGTNALNQLDGMWAFALYDSDCNELLLARDPFGEKPLYFYQPTAHDYYFGSEIKWLKTLSGKHFTPNKHHLSRFLVNGYKSLYKHPDTFFNEVQKLPSASLVKIFSSQPGLIHTYWHPAIKQSNLSFHEAVTQARELLINSLQTRLRSDVPIAFCMSGGIDSNSLISIAKYVFNYDVHGFTIVNSDKRYEEADMINESITKLKINHHSFVISSDNFIENLRKIIAHRDAPLLTISHYLDWVLHEAIQQKGFRISINGAAGDELFSGYFDHQLMYLYDIRNQSDLLAKSIAHWKKSTASIVRNPYLQDPYTFIHNPFMRKHSYLNCDKYSLFLTQFWQEEFSEKYYRHGLLQNRMLNEIFHETIPVILNEIDSNAMYHSVENRTPFLNRQLFEFAHSIPTEYLIQEGKAKAVLREAMRGIVPDAIVDNKRKVGFNAPITDLLPIHEPSVKDFLLSESPIWDMVRREAVESLLAQTSLPNSDSKFLFSFLSTKIFLENFST